MKHKTVQMLNMTQTGEAQWNICLQNQVSSTLLKANGFGGLFEDTVNLAFTYLWFSTSLSKYMYTHIQNSGLGFGIMAYSEACLV